jgi:hypothetical protein
MRAGVAANSLQGQSRTTAVGTVTNINRCDRHEQHPAAKNMRLVGLLTGLR